MAASRDTLVASQYDTMEAAQAYAEAYRSGGRDERFYQSRVALVSQVLASVPVGELLDVGCGPGMMTRTLLDSRPGDFRITVIDRSEPMIRVCVQGAGGTANVRGIVGRAECMPLPTDRFDVVLALGVLEYCEIRQALSEIARVARPGGLVLMSMLNPLSPYRFVEWHVNPILKRALRLGGKAGDELIERPHGPAADGIRAYSERALREMSAAVGLQTVDALSFDINYLVPPIDRVVYRYMTSWRRHPERTIGRGWRGHFGSAYMLIARKTRPRE